MMHPYLSLALQALTCNAVLLAWYGLALKDRAHHQFNRAYLIAILPVSWLIPMLHFNLTSPIQQVAPIATALHIIQGNAENIGTPVTAAASNFSWTSACAIAMIMVSGLMLIQLLSGIVRLTIQAKRQKSYSVQGATLIPAGTNGSPYSFLRYIFWNDAIAFNSIEGQRIFRHELTHVRQHHTLDKLYMRLALVLNWFNPFAWLISKELSLVQEYLADEHAIEAGDGHAFAGMLLSSTFPAHRSSLIQSFYQSPVKRRLSMITKTIKSYPLLNRLAALPLLTVLLLCFSFRYHPAQPLLKRSFTVVLDAGHGGEDKGAQAEGLRESDLSLDFAKLIQEDLSKKGINVVMTRTNDQTIKLGDRVALAGTANANLFVSVHLNAGTEHSPEPHGFEVVLPFRNTKFEKQNLNLSMELSARMQKIFDQPVIVKKPKQGVYVLDQNPYCPAVLLECGYMTHAGDRAILQDAEKKNEIAANIAESIAAYLSNLK